MMSDGLRPRSEKVVNQKLEQMLYRSKNLFSEKSKDFRFTEESEYHYGGFVEVEKIGVFLFIEFGGSSMPERYDLRDGGALSRAWQDCEVWTSSYKAEKLIERISKKLQNNG